MFQRNTNGLDAGQIQRCQQAWGLLGGNCFAQLNVTDAHKHCSTTCYIEGKSVVRLGADVYPGTGIDANARLSMLACLAHELSHAERYTRDFRRPTELPDMLLDEAETSIHAAFYPVLSAQDRQDLVEDARDRLNLWLRINYEEADDEKS